MESLNKLTEKFQVMDWPGNYLDLNPIQNGWSFVKLKLKDDMAITSLLKLIEAIKMMCVRYLLLTYFYPPSTDSLFAPLKSKDLKKTNNLNINTKR